MKLVHLSYLAFLPFVVSSLDIRLPTGTFRGIVANETERWLGIPYALPPVGDRRFKAPVPVTKRSNSIVDASRFGNACPQPAAESLNAPISEDCLFLNVGTFQLGDNNGYDIVHLKNRFSVLKTPVLTRLSLFFFGYMWVDPLTYTALRLTHVQGGMTQRMYLFFYCIWPRSLLPDAQGSTPQGTSFLFNPGRVIDLRCQI